ncbi:hypothetical protein [uncultured Pseudacidovorax sp.]|uniref:hypothetical protein n=1 Tax=uncultured Pseudacidovorax sp. TaxID=679313 RepID=UPI0025EAF03D|nr:hypothetical protein [uncultured Pseudacidovorax sp.]
MTDAAAAIRRPPSTAVTSTPVAISCISTEAPCSATPRSYRARTQAADAEVFHNPRTGSAYIDEQSQRRAWAQALPAAGVRYRPPKECRDTSVTLALMAGANPVWVAMQHGHSVQVMMRDYAKWIPSADRGANLAAVNATLGARTEGAKGAG